jgi:hypothetical protein
MRKNNLRAVRSRKSFVENLNGVNFGNRALWGTAGAVVVSLLVKIFYVPLIQKDFQNKFFTKLRFWISLVENIAIANILIFFVCIFFFREKIGGKLLFYMQHKGAAYHKDRWIIYWMQTLLIALIIVGITTFISSTIFKSWTQYILLLVLLCLPFLLKDKLSRLQNKFNR